MSRIYLLFLFKLTFISRKERSWLHHQLSHRQSNCLLVNLFSFVYGLICFEIGFLEKKKLETNIWSLMVKMNSWRCIVDANFQESGYVHSSFIMGIEETPVDHYESLMQRLWTIPSANLIQTKDVLGTGHYGPITKGSVQRGDTKIDAALQSIEGITTPRFVQNRCILFYIFIFTFS